MNAPIDDRPTIPITVLGGPTVLIEYAGLRLLTDPTFDEPGAYEMAGLPVSKTRGPRIPADEIGRIDAVLLSHDEHADNLDRSGRELLRRVPLTLTTTSGAARLGGTARGLQPWDAHVLASDAGADVTITAVPARHGPEGSEPYTGDVVGFLLTAPDHASVYVSGDNASLDAVSEIAARVGSVDTAVLFLGGVHDPAFFDDALLTFDDAQGAAAAQLLQARRVVPAHVDGWSHLSGTPDGLVAAFAAAGIEDRLETSAP